MIFEKNEILTDSGTVYHVYSAFAKKWRSKLNNFYLKSYPVSKYLNNLHKIQPLPDLSLDDIGFKPSSIIIPSKKIDGSLIESYHLNRDFPALEKTSLMGIHLRFGTVSIRELAYLGLQLNSTWLSELIWRDFFMYLLYHHPETETRCFKVDYENIVWENDPKKIKAWKEGNTGIPIVDAGMRQLNQTGYMHNRVRMIVASFLCKNLKVDWRIGERYFALKLLDYDLSANVGNWQWVAGCGCDAAPYFRVFNPYLQAEKFDPDQAYIKKYVPEYLSADYKPIVDLGLSRQEALDMYNVALKK